MRRSQSMENLPMLPEEAKMAASLLRLTLSDKQETSTESEFQSYISTHSHFPYHKAVPIRMVLRSSDPIAINGSPVGTNKVPSRRQPTIADPKERLRTLRRRCDSSPSAITGDESKVVEDAASRLSQSAPTENQGFFQRLFPAFLKRRMVSEKNTETSSVKVIPTVQQGVKLRTCETCESNHFVRQISKTNKMDNLIFMSMR